MQSVKIALRTVGVPSPALGIESGEMVSESLTEEYVAQGYVIQNSFFVGDIKDPQGNVLGYKLMFVFVRNEGLATAEMLADVNPEEKAKRGRPAKVA